MKITIELAQLFRMIADVVVEVPDDFNIEDPMALRKLMMDVYDVEDGINYRPDDHWGSDEGTHQFIGEAAADAKPQFKLTEDDVEMLND